MSAPLPINQFYLFKCLKSSLFEDDWFNFVQSWTSMVEVDAPMPEFVSNLVPFFANAPRLIPVFHWYMEFVGEDPDFLQVLTTVLLSTPLLVKVQHILQSTELFSAYMVALKLDCPSASHTTVMQSLQSFLSNLPEPMRLEILRVFAEEEASDSMGLTSSTLDTALQLLHLDTQLYIDILSTLQLNQTENMPWDDVVNKIKDLVQAKKPVAWAGIDQFLKSLHSARDETTTTSLATASSAVIEQKDRKDKAAVADEEDDDINDDDNVLEMIEGVDYTTDEMEEHELGAFPEGEDYDQHYVAFLQDVHNIHQTRHTNDLDEFANLSVDNRQIVESW
ncbi:hypothetical protein BG004_002871 [Podila humilis]|nr:hypothetical protein BG004_002871 [Podila humilis]